MAEISIACRNGMVVAKTLSDDDEDEGPGRILTVEEFIDRLRNRADIFGVDKDRRLRNSEVVTLFFALVAGLFLSQVKTLNVHTDAYMPMPKAPVGTTILTHDLLRPESARPVIPKPAIVNANDRHSLRHAKSGVARLTSSSRQNGGSVREHVVRSGVLAIIAGRLRGKDVATGDILSQEGFAEGIDAIISGIQGLKHGASSAASRRGTQGLNFLPGDGPGYDENGSDGIDGMIKSLMTSTESELPLALKTGPPGRIRDAAIATVPGGVSLNGTGRSRVDIMRVVMQNLSALRYAYNRRLRERPGLTGKITIKFAVDEFGNVIACEVIESSMADSQLEAVITGKILRWRFDKIDKPGDITEVVYPFVFST